MSNLQAAILGLVQGLTEFLPVSSSGHLELMNRLLQVGGHDNLLFAVVVHAATVLSTIVVFRKELSEMVVSVIRMKWNDDTRFVAQLLVSAIPVGIVGLFFKSHVESFFTGNLRLVGVCLLITATFLAVSHYYRRSNTGKIGFRDGLIMGISQAIAVLPGISRSGITISTGLLLGNERKAVARFSFLMVLAPILGAAFLDVAEAGFSLSSNGNFLPLLTGFITAFISGLAACTLMIRIVTRGKLIYFAAYCILIGVIAIFAG